MATLHLLGTGAAFSSGRRTTTMLAFQSTNSTLVVDCGGDVIQRLLASEVPLDSISALILTHEHPDHVGGFPLFMERIWLSGRRRTVPVIGPAAAIDQARKIFKAFDTSGWEGMPDIAWKAVKMEENAEVFEDAAWKVTASPGSHSVPVIGLRVQSSGGTCIAFSADTARSDAIARLASAADILVHEASGDMPHHTSPQDAAHVARQAGVGRLILVHLPPETSDKDLAEARSSFPELEMGEDGASYDL